MEVQTDISYRNVRQMDIITPQMLTECMIVGCGAVGRQVSIMLGGLDVPRLVLVDHDKVSAENLGVQGFPESDIGKPKVESLTKTILFNNSNARILAYPAPFAANQMISDEGTRAIFVCVDDMDVRAKIWTMAGKFGFKYLIDGRMTPFLLRVLAVDSEDPSSKEVYERSLFPQSEAEVGRCTARSTLFSASITAGLMVNAYVAMVRQFPVKPHVSVDLLTMEIHDDSGLDLR